MKNLDNIPDYGADFREDIELAEACGLFPELAAILGQRNFPSSARDKQSLIAKKQGCRLSPECFAYLVFECINTDKTNTQIAKKFGVSHQNVAQLRSKLRKKRHEGPKPIRYRRNGQLYFDFSAST